MFIPGCQWVEIEENCERLVASTKTKFLSLTGGVGGCRRYAETQKNDKNNQGFFHLTHPF